MSGFQPISQCLKYDSLTISNADSTTPAYHLVHNIYRRNLNTLRGSTVCKDITTCFTIRSNGQICKNLFEDIIIERNHLEDEHGQQYKYLKDYASIGIPTEVYNRIIKDINNLYKDRKVESIYKSVSDGYTWIAALLDEDLSCNIYSEKLKTKVSIGYLSNKIAQLKSNVCGFGQFKIQIVGFNFLMFTLSGFQLVKETNLGSGTESTYICLGISDELKMKLGITDK